MVDNAPTAPDSFFENAADVASGRQAALEKENEALKGEISALRNYVLDKAAKIMGLFADSSLVSNSALEEEIHGDDPLTPVVDHVSRILGELNLANDRLRLVHEDLRAIYDLAGAAILLIDNEYNVMAHNRLAQESFSGIEESIIYRQCREVICKGCPPEEVCTLAEVKTTRARVERKEVKLNGRLYDIVASPVLDGHGEVVHTVMTYLDITERHNALTALSRSRKRFSDLFENANDLIHIADLEGRLLYVNRAWKKATGYHDTGAITVPDLLPPPLRAEYFEMVEASRQKGEGVRFETEFIAADGRRVLLDGSISCSEDEDGHTLARAILRDITRQRRLEEEIATSQRMDTVGQLAGGIAHDFNNVLTAILGNISLAKMYEASGYPVADKLTKAEQAVSRARGLTNQLLTFAKGGDPVKKDLNLAPFLAEVVNFTLSGSNVRANFSISGDVSGLEADSGLIEQVMQNLVLNAVQAMPEGGTLEVSAENALVGNDSALPLKNGSYVKITVQDRGVGIPQENLERIFDPFFTTKDGGKGLGLATAFSIIKKHGGTILVSSSLGTGSRFDLFLPAKAQPKLHEPQAFKTAGFGARILIMDDEDEIREMLISLLNHLGYEVAEARDGEAAVNLYKAALLGGSPYDLVIMDLTVPGGMGGMEAMAHIRQIDPDVVAIVSSGYSQDPVMSGYKNYGFSGVADKPYSLETISALVKSLVTRRKALL